MFILSVFMDCIVALSLRFLIVYACKCNQKLNHDNVTLSGHYGAESDEVILSANGVCVCVP